MPVGCTLPSLCNVMERDAYVKMVVAHGKVWSFVFYNLRISLNIHRRSHASLFSIFFRLWKLITSLVRLWGSD